MRLPSSSNACLMASREALPFAAIGPVSGNITPTLIGVLLAGCATAPPAAKATPAVSAAIANSLLIFGDPIYFLPFLRLLSNSKISLLQLGITVELGRQAFADDLSLAHDVHAVGVPHRKP